jgi:DNA-directed RNA polymerase specialized sigma24 family protein
MFRWKTSQDAWEEATELATRSDFQEIFTEDMAELHLLAYLLTADQDKAELCFVAGLEDALQGNEVFRQWARAWSKRAMIKNAIKALSPVPGRRSADRETGGDWTDDPEKNELIAAVTRLETFDRFVFVMAVLESYTLTDCAALLGYSVYEVQAAKSRALQSLGTLQSIATAAPSSREASWFSFLMPTEMA